MVCHVVKFVCCAIYTFLLTIALERPTALAHQSNSCSMTSPCTPLRGGGVFHQPLEVSSSGGMLDTSLIVDIATIQVDWLSVKRRLYNGTFPGPTIRIKANDVLHLKLINRLQEPDYRPDKRNVFGYPNTTNLHTHGLHVSSQVPQDNVIKIRVEPEHSYQYRYEINRQQPSGTYFYHPHVHTAGHFQVFGGMAGMLIVDDDPNTVPKNLGLISCPQNCENDITIVMQEFRYGHIPGGAHADHGGGHGAHAGPYSALQRSIRDYEGFRLNSINITNSSSNLEEWLEDHANNMRYFLVNGMLHPKMTIRLGEAKRLRLLNAGSFFSLALRLVSDEGEPLCDVREIAKDGIYLKAARTPRLGRSFLGSAGRVDWAVECSIPGVYQLESMFTSDDDRSLGDHPKFNGLLMTIEVTGDAINADLPTDLPSLPPFLRDLRSIPASEIDARFAVEITATETLNREDFEEDNIRHRMEVDTVQEWFLTNTEFETSHPMHIHVNSFQVISYNKYTGPYALEGRDSGWALFNQSGDRCTWQFKNYDANVKIHHPPADHDPLQYLGHEEAQATVNSIGYAVIGDHYDTLLVPPLANITIRFVASEYTGDVVVHCHLLPDNDQGMIMVTQIVEKGASMEANVTSAGAYPWSCFENDPFPYTHSGGMGNTHIGSIIGTLILLTFCQQFFTLH